MASSFASTIMIVTGKLFTLASPSTCYHPILACILAHCADCPFTTLGNMRAHILAASTRPVNTPTSRLTCTLSACPPSSWVSLTLKLIIISSFNSLSPEDKAKAMVHCPFDDCDKTWLDPASGCRHMQNVHGRKPYHRPGYIARLNSPKSSKPKSGEVKKRTRTIKKQVAKKEVYDVVLDFSDVKPSVPAMTTSEVVNGPNEATWNAESFNALIETLWSSSQSSSSTSTSSSASSPSALTSASSLYSTSTCSSSGSSPSSTSSPLRTPSPSGFCPTSQDIYDVDQYTLQQQQYDLDLMVQYTNVHDWVDPMSVSMPLPTQTSQTDFDFDLFHNTLAMEQCQPSFDVNMGFGVSTGFDETIDPDLFQLGDDVSSGDIISWFPTQSQSQSQG